MSVAEAFLRTRIGHEDVHYLGDLVAGAKVLEMFGDAATELAIRHDGDEGLLRAYESVEFLAPVHPGDFLEVRGRIVATGKTSRRCELEAYKVIVARPDVSDSAGEVLSEPVLVCRATATTVVGKHLQRSG
jgi:3-aminobutyryl-CoA ammonia-lyase